MLDTLAEWLYANNSSQYEDYAETQRQVAEVQQQRNDQRFQQGKIGVLEYINRNLLIADSDDETAKAREAQASGWAFFKGTWLVWAALLVLLFLWMGGLSWIRGILARKS